VIDAHCLVAHGESKNEARASLVAVVERDVSVVIVRDLAHDREAESRSADGALGREVPLEDLGPRTPAAPRAAEQNH
jgi:hypothetical protein